MFQLQMLSAEDAKAITMKLRVSKYFFMRKTVRMRVELAMAQTYEMLAYSSINPNSNNALALEINS